MAHIMRPRPGEECHDFACGSAGLLVKLQLVARELDPTSKVPLRLTGQELQAEGYAVAQMNGIIHDMDIEIARGDTMINPKFRTADGKMRTFDIVVANPMWNQPFEPDVFSNDPFDRFRTAGGRQGRLGLAPAYTRLPRRSRPRGGRARHRRRHAGLRLEERG
jgi:type I restriction enzyme M protein